jgi:uncharacterized protein (TIGR03437 family)
MKQFATCALAFCLSLGVCSGASGQNVITTIAGTDFTFPPGVTVALNAPLGRVAGVAVDPQGNAFVADPGNNRIFRVSLDGSIQIVAGNGTQGFSGDGGPATSASLSLPVGIALDTAGNLFIADSGNERIRKVSANGTIATVAGNGSFQFSGDGGPATSAAVGFPQAVALDASGNLFIADPFNDRVRKVSTSGIITTVAGGGGSGLSGDGGPATSAFLVPSGLAVDVFGNLFVADTGNDRIRKISTSGIITTVAGGGNSVGDGGPATAALLNYPQGVAVDASGNLFIADATRIRKVSSSGIITTSAGNGVSGFSGDGGPATSGSVSYPQGVAVDASGNLLIADTGNERIREVSAGGIITTVVGNGEFGFSGDGGPAVSASLLPNGVAVDASGNLYIVDVSNYRVRKISPGGIITTVAGNGTPGLSGDGGPATSASLSLNSSFLASGLVPLGVAPCGVAVDASGNLFIADTNNNVVRKVSASGIITTVAGNGVFGLGGFGGPATGDGGPATAASLGKPSGVAVDASGNLFIAETASNRIRKVSPSGIITTAAGNGYFGFAGDGGPAPSASLDLPTGVAVDGSGNLFIAEYGNERIRKVSSSGIMTTVAGNGTSSFSGGFSGDGGPATSASLNVPTGVAVDPSGNLFIADQSNNRIRKVSPDGVINTFAGGGSSGLGDGGPATSASLSYPVAVAVDASGDLFIADSFDNRVREVAVSAPMLNSLPTQLNLSLAAGGSSSPQISLTSAVAGLAWSTTASSNWITLTPTSGTTPGIVTAAINTASLQPGAYTAGITISSPLAFPSQQTVSVSLMVAAATAGLSVAPTTLNFQIQQGAPAQSQSVTVGSAGGGSLTWTAQGDPANPWISVSPSSGSASVAASASVQVTATLAGLSPGVYSGTIKVSSATTGSSSAVTVNLLVTPAAPAILLSQTGLTFTGIEGGGIVPPQTFGVLNAGGGGMNWTAGVTSSSSWLTLSSASGTSVANSANPPLVQVNADATNLLAGKYIGQIQISSTGAANTPQIVNVVLNVLPKGSPLPPVVRPTGLIFVRQAGTSSPGSQIVILSTAQPATIQAIVNPPALVQDQISQNVVPSPLTISPLVPAFSPGHPNQIVVQPNLGTLTPGEYFGAFTVTSGQDVQTVNVLFVVTAGPTNDIAPEVRDKASAVSCTAQRLFLTVQTLSNNFSSAVGYPQTIRARVVDDCNNPGLGATTIATFTSDPPRTLALVDPQGIFETSWVPFSAAPVTVTVRAASGSLTPAQVSFSGQVSGVSLMPPTFTNGASFVANGPLAPGSIISAFAPSGLAGSTAQATMLPLPTSLGGAQLSIGGRNVPLLYASPTQVNAQIPLDVPPNSSQSVSFTVAQTSGPTVTAPQTLTIAVARAGIFANPQGQGAITDANGAILTSGNPASTGQEVVIYATGLGPVNQPIALGAPAPASPPATITTRIQVTVGGQNATVAFAGLTSGFVGLYQVNVIIPAGVTPGSAVPVVITQDSVASNTATIAVR